MLISHFDDKDLLYSPGNYGTYQDIQSTEPIFCHLLTEACETNALKGRPWHIRIQRGESGILLCVESNCVSATNPRFPCIPGSDARGVTLLYTRKPKVLPPS
jgi:hypothetical protein